MPYLVVTARVPRQIAAQCKELARALGWQLADFLRTAIFLGAAFFCLTVDNPKAETSASTLLRGLELLKPSRSLMSFSFKLGARPYARRILGRKSALITFALPNSMCDQIAILAELWGASRNEAYNKSLRQGLLICLKAQESALIASRKRSAHPKS
jgi:hypothetical protein